MQIHKIGSDNLLKLSAQGKIDLTDIRGSEELRLDFEGVHFIQNGSIYAFADPSG